MVNTANDNTPAAALMLRAENVRGLRAIETPLDAITLVAGRNGAGKTSLAQALAAVVTGAPPLPGLKKSELHLLLRSGTAAGVVELTTPTGRAAYTLPDGKASSEGAPPQASPYAAGIVSVLDLPAKQAAQGLAAYIDAEPTRDDLRRALPDLPEEAFAIIWQDVEASGWDGAHANARENGARIKGKWEETTGERFGLKKAAAWRPQGWEPDLAEATEADLADAAEVACSGYSEAIKTATVSGAERERLEALARVWADRKAATDAARVSLDKAHADAEKARTALEAVPPVEAAALTCPHCGGAVEIVGGQIVAYSGELDPAARAERKAKVDAAFAATQAAREALRTAQGAYSRAEAELQDSTDAQKQLADMPPATEGDLLAAEKAQAAHEHAEARFRAKQLYTKATMYHQQVIAYAAIVGALAPDGVRAAKLSRALKDFNARLAALCEVARFPAVRLESNLSASYGDRPYMLLSESEQYRARAVVQAAMAQADGSALVIFDRADLLDRDGRNGLFALALHIGLPAVVCMTADGPDAVPDLARKGLGRTVWLTSGEAAA